MSRQRELPSLWVLGLISLTTLFGLQLLRAFFPLTLYVLGAKVGLSTPIARCRLPAHLFDGLPGGTTLGALAGDNDCLAGQRRRDRPHPSHPAALGW